MTERSESERAELVALADWIEKSDYLVTPGIRACKQIVAALRSLAAPDQKPVGYGYSAEIQSAPGELLHVCRERKALYDTPLYLSPPPAAGWDEAIEACKKVAEKWFESFMGGEVYVARSIVNAIEALRTPAATKSADAGGGVPDHGRADAGVKAQIATLAQRFWTIHPRELQDKGMTREEFYIREMTALVAALSKPAPVARYSIEFDGFTGTVIGSYTTLEGKEGVVLQQDGTRVVHVYGRKHLKPAPVAANASAEARLREALENTNQLLIDVMHDQEADIRDRAFKQFDKNIDALSAHPHASDCDKQGETTKSEGGEGSPQDGKVGGSEQPYSAGTRQGREIPQSSKPKAECACSISAAPLPSDRTADVTGYLPIHECYETGDDEVTVVELKTFLDKQWPAPHGDVARAILGAFTVGRR